MRTLLTMMSFVCLLACGNNVSRLHSSEVSAAQVDTLTDYQELIKDPNFKRQWGNSKKTKLDTYLGALKSSASDDAGAFEGVGFSQIAKKIAGTKLASGVANLKNVYPTIGDLLVAQGLSDSIGSVDLQAYEVVAKAALLSLSTGAAFPENIDLKTRARALNVGLALDAYDADTLGLSYSGTRNVCSKFGKANKKTASWWCVMDKKDKKTVHASIGYRVVNDGKAPDVWQDAFKSSASFPFCSSSAVYQAGAEVWGWENGKSCHVALTQQSGDTAGSKDDPTKDDPTIPAKTPPVKDPEKTPAKAAQSAV